MLYTLRTCTEYSSNPASPPEMYMPAICGAAATHITSDITDITATDLTAYPNSFLAQSSSPHPL